MCMHIMLFSECSCTICSSFYHQQLGLWLVCGILVVLWDIVYVESGSYRNKACLVIGIDNNLLILLRFPTGIDMSMVAIYNKHEKYFNDQITDI